MAGGFDWQINRDNLADVAPGRRVFGAPRRSAGLLNSGSLYKAPDDTGDPGSSLDPGNGVTLGDLTTPAPRPIVYQTAVNFSLIVTPTPQPIMNISFPADAIVIAVPSGGTAVNFGYGSGITTSTGIQIIANQPVEIASDNTREQWELQRALEALVALVGGGALSKYRAPRVVLNLQNYFLVGSAATQAVACMAFYIPEGQ